MAVIAGLVVARGSNMRMYIANLLPLSLMTAARFLLGDSVTDMVMGGVAPFVAFQMWYTGRPLVLRMGEDARLRFKVEDMARELEETRDEALRKRFEAEAANASKTAFLANMSHELRTPLNAILGFSEIIAQECFGPVASARYRDYAGDIHASGAHLLSLINDLLDVAKIEAGRMEIAPHPLDARAHLRRRAEADRHQGAREETRLWSIAVEPECPAALCRRARAEADPDQPGVQCRQVHAAGRQDRGDRQPRGQRRLPDHGARQWAGHPARKSRQDLHSPSIRWTTAMTARRAARAWGWRWCAV